MTGMTLRQRQILVFVQSWIATRGYSPTYAEICVGFGFRSTMAAQSHVRALIKKGFLTSEPRKTRTIRVVKGKR